VRLTTDCPSSFQPVFSLYTPLLTCHGHHPRHTSAVRSVTPRGLTNNIPLSSLCTLFRSPFSFLPKSKHQPYRLPQIPLSLFLRQIPPLSHGQICLFLQRQKGNQNSYKSTRIPNHIADRHGHVSREFRQHEPDSAGLLLRFPRLIYLTLHGISQPKHCLDLFSNPDQATLFRLASPLPTCRFSPTFTAFTRPTPKNPSCRNSGPTTEES